MAIQNIDAGAAPFFMMITFEVAPEDESEFNRVYDTDHIPTLLRLEGVLGVIRFRDAVPNEKGWLVYSALYLLAQADLHETPAWKAASDLGRWAPDIRPLLKSRHRRSGPIIASFKKPAR